MSDIAGVVEFLFELMDSVCYLPYGQLKLLREFKFQKYCKRSNDFCNLFFKQICNACNNIFGRHVKIIIWEKT